MSLPSERQEVGDHLDEQGGIHAIAGQLHVFDVQERFEDLPELFDGLVGFPDVPDFSAPQARPAEVDQVVGAGGAFLEEEQGEFAKGGAMGAHPEGRHINAPLSQTHGQGFLPDGRRMFFRADGEGVIALASQHDPGKAQLPELVLQLVRDKPGVQSDGQGCQVNAVLSEAIFQLLQHGKKQVGFIRIGPPLLGTKQQMQGNRHPLDRQHDA